MNKKIIQDVLIKKRQIRRKIPMSSHEPETITINASSAKQPEVIPTNFSQQPLDQPPILTFLSPDNFPKKKFSVKIIIFLFSLVAVAIIGSLILNNFASVDIKITPRQIYVEVDCELAATKNNDSKNLSFETAQMDYELARISPATGIGNATDKDRASGQIIIYNNYSSDGQKLIANTRFQSPTGKIYRTRETLIVPGMGSVETTIYAEKTGAEYNTGLTDFTIPGFQDSSKYEKIFARSKTEIRVRNNFAIISVDDIKKSKTNLEQKIESYLKENVNRQNPETYISYDNTAKIIFEGAPENPKPGEAAGSQSGEFTFKEKGRIIKFFFKKDALQKILAEKYISDAEKDKIELLNLQSLEFNIIFINEENTEIQFKIKGRAHFAWKVDMEILANELVSATNKKYLSVFKQYPAIENAQIFFKPSWFEMMPKNKNRIHLENILH